MKQMGIRYKYKKNKKDYRQTSKINILERQCNKLLIKDERNNKYINKCLELGKMKIDMGNIAEAEKIFKKVCSKDNKASMKGCVLKGIMEYGRASNRSKIKFINACDNGLMEGCHAHGILEYNKRNIVKAKKIFKEICKKGFRDGCNTLNALRGRERDVVKVRDNFQEMCDHGVKFFCPMLKVSIKARPVKRKITNSDPTLRNRAIASNSMKSKRMKIEKSKKKLTYKKKTAYETENIKEIKVLYPKQKIMILKEDCDKFLLKYKSNRKHLNRCVELGKMELREGSRSIVRAKRIFKKICDSRDEIAIKKCSMLKESIQERDF